MNEHHIYWAAFYDNARRTDVYIEFEYLGGDKWGVLIDGKEFTINGYAPTTTIYQLLSVALSRV